jgi:hypothetical protein
MGEEKQPEKPVVVEVQGAQASFKLGQVAVVVDPPYAYDYALRDIKVDNDVWVPGSPTVIFANEGDFEIQRRRADRLVSGIAPFIPRKYRDDFLMDMADDLGELRDAGWGEWRVIFHVIWQFTWLLYERLRHKPQDVERKA